MGYKTGDGQRRAPLTTVRGSPDYETNRSHSLTVAPSRLLSLGHRWPSLTVGQLCRIQAHLETRQRSLASSGFQSSNEPFAENSPTAANTSTPWGIQMNPFPLTLFTTSNPRR